MAEHLLAGPTLVDELDLEYSVHSVPRSYRDEVRSVVHPGILSDDDFERLRIVCTCQRAREDLVKMGEKIEAEKDRLLEAFVDWSKKLCGGLQELGHWADYVDPCSGLLMIHKESQAVYDEVSALSVLRGYECSNAGCCKVVLHPKWGSFIYPATVLTTAPAEAVLEQLKQQSGASS